MVAKKIIYVALLIGLILVGYQIWTVANILQAREVGFLFWEGILNILLLLMAGILSFAYKPSDKSKSARNGILIVIGMLIFDVFVMLNYATTALYIGKLSFYFHLHMTASIIILAAMIGNVVRIEKKQIEGFNVWIHSEDSPITPKMILPVWFIIFMVMAGFVMISGTVLVQYPDFGILPQLGGPATSGFAPGNSENIVMIILPFAIIFAIFKIIKFPNWSCFLIALMGASSVFTYYHAFTYTANVVALLIVFIFGAIAISSYYFTRSIVIAGAMHISNNFFGALFSVNVVGFSVFGTTAPAGAIIFSMAIMAVMIIGVIWLIRRFGGRKKKNG